MHIKFYFFTNVLKKLVDKTLNFNNIYKTQIMIVILMENQVRGWLWLVQHWLGKERNVTYISNIFKILGGYVVFNFLVVFLISPLTFLSAPYYSPTSGNMSWYEGEQEKG